MILSQQIPEKMSLLMIRAVQRQCRQPFLYQLNARSAGNFTLAKAQDTSTLNKEFWSKNSNLNRPMSPHLSIYKPQLTTTLSILHRATGLGASVVLYAGGIAALFSEGYSFPELVQLMQENVPQSLLLATKTALGGAFIYHTLNGVRHLIWDMGYGFQIKHLYMSGYVVIALTAIGTAMIFIRG